MKKILLVAFSVMFVLQLTLSYEISKGGVLSLDKLKIAFAQTESQPDTPIEYPPDTWPSKKGSFKEVVVQEEVGHNEYYSCNGQLLIYYVVDTPEVIENVPCCTDGTIYDSCGSGVMCEDL